MTITTQSGAATAAPEAPAAELLALAATDRRVARQLAAAERERAVEAQRIARDDATAARGLQVAEQRARMAREKHTARQAEADKRRQDRQAQAEQRRQARAQRRAAAVAWLLRIAPVVGRQVVLVGPIVFPMAVAWVGQIGFATKVMDWVLPAAVCFAAAWELSTVYVARLAYEARAAGDRALLLRCGTWVLASGAATMNYWHAAPSWQPNGVAVSYGVMSLLGITLWEAYAAVQHRKSERAEGRQRASRPRLGLAYWLRYPTLAWAAWSAAIADPAIRTHAQALTAARLAADAKARAQARAEVADLARTAARRAARRGQAGPALVALRLLAETGVPAAVPAIAATAAPVPASPAVPVPPTGTATPTPVPARRTGTAAPVPVRSTGTATRPVPATGTAAAGTAMVATGGTGTGGALVVATGTGTARPPVPTAAGVRSRPLAAAGTAAGGEQGSAKAAARAYWEAEVAAGRMPTGPDLARAAGRDRDDSGMFRRWARTWPNELVTAGAGGERDALAS
jgi:hypothetical protein